jgi:hypothetical protein
VSQPSDPDYGFGEVLPDQTTDEAADPADRADGDADPDLRRLLDDKPPHHLG